MGAKKASGKSVLKLTLKMNECSLGNRERNEGNKPQPQRKYKQDTILTLAKCACRTLGLVQVTGSAGVKIKV